MNKLWVIARKDIIEAFKSRSTYIYIILLIVFSFIYISNYGSQINNLVGAISDQEALTADVQTILDSFTVILPLLFAIWVCTVFATYSVVIEKSKRNLETLMVTPVSLKQIWLGKSLAITLPAVALGITVSLIGYIALNVIYITPHFGGFMAPGLLPLITAIVIDSVLVFSVVSIVVNLQLTFSNPRFANFVFLGIFFLLFFGGSILIEMGIKLDFSYIYLIAFAIFSIISYLLSRSLTKERVILSSKG